MYAPNYDNKSGALIVPAQRKHGQLCLCLAP